MSYSHEFRWKKFYWTLNNQPIFWRNSSLLLNSLLIKFEMWNRKNHEKSLIKFQVDVCCRNLELKKFSATFLHSFFFKVWSIFLLSDFSSFFLLMKIKTKIFYFILNWRKLINPKLIKNHKIKNFYESISPQKWIRDSLIEMGILQKSGGKNFKNKSKNLQQ